MAMIRIAARCGGRLAMIIIAIALSAFVAGEPAAQSRVDETPTSRQQINLTSLTS